MLQPYFLSRKCEWLGTPVHSQGNRSGDIKRRERKLLKEEAKIIARILMSKRFPVTCTCINIQLQI